MSRIEGAARAGAGRRLGRGAGIGRAARVRQELTGIGTHLRSPGVFAGVVICLCLCACAGGMPNIPSSSDAILARGQEYFNRGKYFESQELFKAFLERFAGHDRSDFAQYMLAESYFRQEEYALAAVEYRVLVTNYGYSEYVDDGFFKEALCNYNLSPKAQLDQTKALEALSQLEQFIRVYPTSPLVPEARNYIGEIHEKLAKKDFETATFYFDRGFYVSALIYLDKVIAEYPDNPFGLRAKYLKAKTLSRQGGRTQEAASLLRDVIAETTDPDMKAEAEVLLAALGTP